MNRKREIGVKRISRAVRRKRRTIRRKPYALLLCYCDKSRKREQQAAPLQKRLTFSSPPAYHREEVIAVMCRKKLSPIRRRIRRYIAVFLAVLVLCTVYFETAVKRQLRDILIRDMQTLSEQAVTQAVDELLYEQNGENNKTCDITYKNGSVASISANAAYINSVKTFITARAQSNIDELSHTKGVSVRLGNFTGLVFLSDFGPEITFPVDSAQTVSCEFQSSFEGAGVNQTVHHITVTVTVDLLIYSPFRVGETVATSSSYEISQTVIVGSVPSYGGIVNY